MRFQEQVGHALREAVAEQRLTHREIAARMGVTRARVTIMLGDENLELATVERLCEAIGVEPLLLLGAPALEVE